MTFLNQALLFGLIAVAVPVIIHLLNRRRFRRVPWAAMRFLNVSVEQNQRRMKIEDLILLLLRCLLLALLALALARPVIEGFEGVLPGSKVAAVVVVDNSASMGTVEDGATRLERAKEAARDVLSRLPRGGALAVGTPFAQSEPTTDRALMRERIDDLQGTDRSGGMEEALARALATLSGLSAAEKEIYLVSDGQAGDWDRLDELTGALQEELAGVRVHVLLVGEQVGSNLAVSRIAPSGGLPAVGRPFRVDVDVTNHGDDPVLDVPVSLLVDGQPVEEAWVISEIGAGRTESATFYPSFPTAGPHRLEVEVPGDATPFDDRRSLVVTAVDDVRVLVVDGDPGASERNSETFFLRLALTPVPDEDRAAYPVKPSVIPVSELSGQDLSAFHVVILANVADVPLPVAATLESFVRVGGGLMIFGGENVRPEVYNALLGRKHGLLPARFDVEADAPSGPVQLAVTEGNPLGLDEEMVNGVTVNRWSPLELPSGAGVALQTVNGTPLLVEGSLGLGRTYLFASTADTSWTDLPVKPVFVPLISRMLGGIVQQREAGVNLEAGESLRLLIDPRYAGRSATVSELGNPEALGRLVPIVSGERGALLEFDGVDRAGVYQATIEGVEQPRYFSARPGAMESGTALFDVEEIEDLGRWASVARWTADGGAVAGERKGSELWLVLIFTLIGVAALELSLAQWFSRPK